MTQSNTDSSSPQPESMAPDNTNPGPVLNQVGESPGRWLKKAADSGKKAIKGAVFCGLVLTLLTLVQCFLIALLVHSAVIDKSPVSSLWPLFLLLLGVFCARFPLAVLQDLLSFRAAAAIKLSLRDFVFHHLMALGPAYAKTHSSGSLSTLLTAHIEALEGFYCRFLPLMRLAAYVPLVLVLVVFPISWAVGLLLLILGPMIPLCMALIGKRTQKASDRQAKALTQIGGYYLDRLQALGSLKVFGAAESELERIAEVSHDFRKRTMTVLRIAFLSSTALEFFASLALAMVALYVGASLLGLLNFGLTGWIFPLGEGSGGDMTLFIAVFLLLLAPEFFQPLRQLAAAYHDRASAVAAAEEIQKLLQAESPGCPEGTQDLPAPQERITLEVKDLTFAYHDRPQAYDAPTDNDPIGTPSTAPTQLVALAPPVLQDLSFRLEPGDAVGLSAPSGSGKSTLIDLLLGFRTPESGQILLNGCPLKALRETSRTQAMTWIGQAPMLFQGSLRENILMGAPEASPEQLDLALQQAHVWEFAHILPEGLDTMLGENGLGLSGGQGQRVALARALLSPAPILLMDEPTANLDHDSENAILACLQRLKGQRTLLIATHSPAVLEAMDRVLWLTEAGTLQEGERP